MPRCFGRGGCAAAIAAIAPPLLTLHCGPSPSRQAKCSRFHRPKKIIMQVCVYKLKAQQGKIAGAALIMEHPEF